MPDQGVSRRGLGVALLSLSAFIVGCGGGTTSRGESTTTRATSTTTSTVPSRSWTSLPPAPISGRLGAGVVWDGSEMIVWGGGSRAQGITTLEADGAAYNPVTRTWRTIAPAPPGVLGGAGGGSAWTGTAAVFWAGNSPDGPAGGAVYHPKTDTWTRLAAGPLGVRESYSSVWTGRELLIISGNSGDALATPVAAAANPETGSWRLLPTLDNVTGLQALGAVWSGREAFIMGNRSLCPEQGSDCQSFQPIFIAYNPTTDALRQIDLANSPVGTQKRSQLRPIAWTGTTVLFADVADPTAGVVSYDPATGSWHTGRPAPCAIPDPSYSQTAWIGHRYVVACGTDGLQIYTPATDTWQTSHPGPSPLNSHTDSAIVWTGTELIAWSGTLRETFNPTPNEGASLVLAG